MTKERIRGILNNVAPQERQEAALKKVLKKAKKVLTMERSDGIIKFHFASGFGL